MDFAASSPQATDPEQAVIVDFKYGSTNFQPLLALDGKLMVAIVIAGVGEYDGHEMWNSGEDAVLFMYGQDADCLFQVVEPILKSTPFMRGARAEKRYGPPGGGVKSVVVVIVP